MPGTAQTIQRNVAEVSRPIVQAPDYASFLIDTLLFESEAAVYKNPRLVRTKAEDILMLNRVQEISPHILAQAYTFLGYAFFLEENFDSALVKLTEAERTYQRLKDSKESGRVHNLMSACFQKKGDIKSAIALNYRALSIFDASGDDLCLASSLENLGMLFASQASYEEAADFSLRAPGIRQFHSDSLSLALTLLHIAEMEAHLFNFSEVKAYKLLALKIFRKYHLDYDRARALQQLGYVLGKLGEEREGIQLLHAASNIHEKLGHSTSLARDKTYLGQLYLQIFQIQKAESLTLEAMDPAGESNDKRLFLVLYRQWASILSKKGMAEPALLWYKKAYELRDSLLSLGYMNHLTRVEAKLAIGAKDQENAMLKIQSQGQERQIVFQRRAIWLAITALILILGLFMLKRAYRIQEMQKQEIEKQAMELQRANHSISETNLHLEENIQRRTIEILEKNKKLEAFAFSLSHRFRSPLANILGMLTLLKSNPEDKCSLYLDKLESSALKLDQIIRQTSHSLEFEEKQVSPVEEK